MKCKYCAMEIPEEARICPHCRKLIRAFARRKWKAVLFAHIFGALTWLYTWKWDKVKFIIMIILWLALAIPFWLSMQGNIDALSCYGGTFFIAYIPFSLWAVILAWSRKKENYWEY